MQRSETEFEGLSLHDSFPLAWQPSPLTDPAELEHHNRETARALQALALFEESPKELPTDMLHQPQQLLHLEAKVDVLLSLVTRLVSQGESLPAAHSAVLRADTIEWTGPDVDQVRNGDTGVVVLYPNAMLPLPFRLPGRVVGSADRAGARWKLMRFEQVAPIVAVGLEKLVFRRHRRQVAISKATDVFGKTGSFQRTIVQRAPKS